MLKRLGRLYRTIRYIKPLQACYQVKNRLITVKPLLHYHKDKKILSPKALNLISLPARKTTAEANKTFTFLNLSFAFPDKINWNYDGFGKLWNYNLQYLDYINEINVSEDIRISWIRDLYTSLNTGTLKIEPYPLSLRTMNLIRFFSEDESRISRYKDIVENLQSELTYLNENYEYHLLGNHILENAFSMLMGGYFFNNTKWRCKAQEILTKQLNEQILKDGAHFELSPMYHKIILFRVLEALSYISPEDALFLLLQGKCRLMLGWLRKMTFANGEIPHFNDSTDGIAFTSEQLSKLAGSLNLIPQNIMLTDSGYRKYENGNVELITDVTGIQPAYQPGHNHSDHLSFVLYGHGNPFIVDPGISTYNVSERRNWERSTKAHNTVTVDNMDQSEVWSSFRVGQRAQVKIITENNAGILASVEYKGIRHVRDFAVSKNTVVITDSINSNAVVVARFYLHPSVLVNSTSDNLVNFNNGLSIAFKNILEYKFEDYDFAEGFNKLRKAKVILALFKGTCTSTFISS